MLDKSMGLTVDCAAYDVEDSVTPDLKQSARHGLRDFLNTTRPKGIINVKGIYYGTAALMPRLLKQGQGGVMLNVASVGATRPRPGLVWYNASKGAVWNVTKGLAAEFGPHKIRVNSVSPLLGATGLFEAFSGVPDTPPENRQKFLDNVPLRRLCEAEDVANACVYLASDEASFITGINLEVDGGRAV
ncbi:4-formylbenzenesulfonate dehydrogenase [Scedosporium apiospermum]|uniref:4-formylbenzenesulfonate dehydrogenase n=1 Tax=Pseudallescheria apiosperma TaxID=563466 RepID=A0A084GG40_PSEDA|nr:4-formylbenzenesulfonate dehydrogenase [Scedosporium apiospermum]KEZ46302.1 4-formylbenzenesulfonate dehydrogenase [Scedosporium apiospermum]